MLECEISEDQGIATVTLKKPRFGFGAGQTLEDGLSTLEQLDPKGIIFDASGLKKMSHGMLVGLLDVFIRLERARAFRSFALALALCSLPEKTFALAKAQGFDRIIPLFSNIKSARAHTSFKSIQLQGVPSVVLCANQGTRLAPMTNETPAALLDFLGRPMLGRVLDHAGKFGLRHFIVNPGFCERQVNDFAQKQTAASIFCVNESSWQTKQFDDVATLVRLHRAHGGFGRDTFVFQSNVLSDADLGDMMQFHRKTGADATIAVGQNRRPSACDGGDQNTDHLASAILLSPWAAETLAKQSYKIRDTRIIPALRAAHLDIQLFVSDHSAAAIKCGADYFACQAAVLKHCAFGVKPIGDEIAPQTWLAYGSEVDSKVEIGGPCFIAENARVSRGTVLQGTNVIGDRSIVHRNAVLSNSILMPDTQAHKNSFVDHIITSAKWSINHRFADGSLQNRAVLDGISSAMEVTETHQDRFPKIAEIA